MNYILYHDDADGYCSALAAYIKFGDIAKYIVVQYGQVFPLDINTLRETDNVYVLDFSYDRATLNQVNLACKLTVLDHHDTAEEQLRGATYAIFDRTKAGCVLSWEYFFPERQDIPDLFLHVQDRDLWRFNLGDDTRALDLGMRASGRYSDLKFWKEVYDSNEKDGLYDEILVKGRLLLESLNARVTSVVSNPSKYKQLTTNWFNGNEYNIVVSNVVNDISEIGNAFNNEIDIDFSCTYFLTNKGEVVLSLRGNDRRNLHLGQIAKVKGGGGHRLAAGIKLSLEQGMEFLNMVYNK